MPRVGGKGWGYVQHMGLLLRGHSKGGLMALFAAHLDKSGDVDEPLVVVAGFIASDFKWDVLGEQWKKTMEVEGVSDFHMADFFRNNKEFPRKEWPRRRKDRLMKLLTRLVTDYTIRPIAYAVTAKAIREAKLGDTRKYIGDQYRFACFLCVQDCIEWARSAEALRERVDFIFDNDGRFYTDVTTAYAFASENAFLQHKWKIGNFAFSDRHCSPGIQAADMFAYLVFEYRRRWLRNRKAKSHTYLDWLLPKGIPSGLLIDNKEFIERWGRQLEEALGKSFENPLKGFNPKRKGGCKDTVA
jgi:hypothetical protein